MKTQVLIREPYLSVGANSLHNIVNIIAGSLEQTISRNKSFIVNDVPEGLLINTDEDLLASILSNLVNEVITHTDNGCIRITAKIYHNLILLHIKNDGSLNFDSVSQKLSRIQKQAEKMGGFVGFTSYRNKLTTIAFSFINEQPQAAGGCFQTISSPSA